MASEPLSRTSNCKQKAKVGAFWVEQMFSSRGLYSDVGQEGQLGAGHGAEPWASAWEKRTLFHVESVSS